MPGRLNYTDEDYLNLFIICGKCNKLLSRKCEIFADICKSQKLTNHQGSKYLICYFGIICGISYDIFKIIGSTNRNFQELY